MRRPVRVLATTVTSSSIVSAGWRSILTTLSAPAPTVTATVIGTNPACTAVTCTSPAGASASATPAASVSCVVPATTTAAPATASPPARTSTRSRARLLRRGAGRRRGQQHEKDDAGRRSRSAASGPRSAASKGVGQWLYSREGVGAGERTRTADLLITNQLLYQLSYAGVVLESVTHGKHGRVLFPTAKRSLL